MQTINIDMGAITLYAYRRDNGFWIGYVQEEGMDWHIYDDGYDKIVVSEYKFRITRQQMSKVLSLIAAEPELCSTFEQMVFLLQR